MMTYITSYDYHASYYRSTKNGSERKKTHKRFPFRFLKGVKNTTTSFKNRCLKLRHARNNVKNINSLHHRVRAQAISHNTIKSFIIQKLEALDLIEKAKQDTVYASQACDAALASVYSNKKDVFCKEMISLGLDTSEYLREAGYAAKNVGLEGQMHNDIFIPAGSGANPFLTAIISSTQRRYPRLFLNKNRQATFREYAERKILCKVGKICQAKGIITPSEFGLMLDKIASKYLSGGASEAM
ncbi:hypothetical protein [Enterobacter sp. 22466]|uniref:hypothetical protein n=1 Tax=Enterobacter sp. 22466 TaxID=3453924 RepID=UPI003F85E6F5